MILFKIVYGPNFKKRGNFMKLLSLLFLTLTVFLFSLIAFCADATDPLATGDFFTQLWQLIGQGKGASGLGLAVAITQGFMLFFRTEMANFTGKWKLTIVLGLSMAVGIMTLRTSGASWSAALFNSATLAAVQVFGHQLMKQLSKKDTSPTPLKAA